MTQPIFPVLYPIILTYCTAIHLTWAGALLWDDAATRITGMADLAAIGVYPLAVLLIVVALLAVFPMWRPQRGLRTIGYAIPQQIVLTFAAGTAVAAMINSTFPDGVARPRAFIVADQAPAVMAAIFHTIAIVANYWRTRWDQNS